MISYRHLILFSYFYSILINLTQAQNLQFELVNTESGLTQNYINSITEDNLGFLWISTPSGLNRYDGYEFKEFKHNPADSSSLGGNKVRVVLNDSNGKLWVGHERGLDWYNQMSGAFHRFSLGRESLITNIINGNDNDIWVMDVDCNVYHIQSDAKSGDPILRNSYKSAFAEIKGKAKSINTICIDSRNRLWIYGSSIVEVIEFNENRTHSQFLELKLLLKNPEIGLGKALSNNPTLESSELQGMIQGKDGIIWLFGNKILTKIEGENVSSIHVDELPNSEQIFIYNASYHGFHDSNNFLWLYGLIKDTHFVIDLNKMIVHPKNDQIFNEIQVGVTDIFESQNHTLWLGSNANGLYKGVQHKTIFNNPPASSKVDTESIHALCKDLDGNIWFYSERKLFIVKNGQNKAEAITSSSSALAQNSPTESLKYTYITFIQPGEKGTVWYGRTNGLYRLSIQNGQIQKNQFFPLIKKRDDGGIDTLRGVCDMTVDATGRIWVVTSTELGIFDLETNFFDGHPYRKALDDEPAKKLYVSELLQTDSNTFWIGTMNGLVKYQVHENEFSFYSNSKNDINSISSDNVKSLLQDPINANVLWIGTNDNGLDRLDMLTNQIQHYTIADGLPDETIYGILSDGNNTLWISTNKGLCSFDKESKEFYNHTKHDGLQDNEFNGRSYYQAEDGELIFGGIHGINRFYPKQLYHSDFSPKTIITELKINNELVNLKNNPAILSQQIEKAREVFIDHHSKLISLTLAGLDLSIPEKIEYQYKLEGFSEDWINIGKNNILTFTNLPYGDYSLKIRSTNRSGIWSNNINDLKIHALTPWWQRWWAFSLYALAIAISIYMIYQFQLKRENERREAQRLLELDTFKSRLFTNITHEFRTPLTVIMGMTGMIKDQNELTDSIQSNAGNLLQMVNQILDLAKLESNKLEIKYINGNIVEYIKHLTKSLVPLAIQQKKQLNIKTKSEIIIMDYDEMKIRHILINLLSNALKFTAPGDDIIVEVDRINEDTLHLSVTDTGVGIPEEKLDRIFDRFFQADNSSTRQAEGTGIGLALCYELVDLLGGALQVESKLNEGSKFSISLPIQNESAQGEFSLVDDMLPNARIQVGTDNKTPSNASKPLLLLIEDNYEIVHFIEMLLESEYRVVHAENGARGIEEAISLVPDVIISDVMMPLKNGYEVTETLKADIRTSHIPIILLTAKSSQADKNTGLEKGADAYLRKPFDQAELQIRLKKLIELRQSLITKFKGLQESSEKTDELENEFLSQVKNVVLANLQNTEFNIELLEESMKLSKMQLYRKLKALTGMSPTLVIRNIRLNRAADLLKEGQLNVSEVAYEVGFNDPSYFTRAFKEIFNHAPSDHK